MLAFESTAALQARVKQNAMKIWYRMCREKWDSTRNRKKKIDQQLFVGCLREEKKVRAKNVNRCKYSATYYFDQEEKQKKKGRKIHVILFTLKHIAIIKMYELEKKGRHKCAEIVVFFFQKRTEKSWRVNTKQANNLFVVHIMISKRGKRGHCAKKNFYPHCMTHFQRLSESRRALKYVSTRVLV